MSTHSAPFGTSRKPAGNTAIIRCMAAMFVMLFTLAVGNMWGATYYYDIEAVAVIYENGASGTVGTKTGGGTSNSTDVTASTYASVSWSSDSQILNKTTTGKTSKATFLAKAANGSVFDGWYKDADCTIPSDYTVIIPNNGDATKYGQTKPVHIIVLDKHTTANTSDNPYHYKLYAKFVKEATGNKFKPQLTVTSSNFSQGHIAISMTDATGISLQKAATTSGPVEYTLTEKSSLSQTFSVRAQPMRGYKFVNWTVAGTPRTTDKATSDLPLESFTVTLTDEMTPGANDVISNNDVVTANFVADELKDFKIQKEANVGTVSGSYSYYYIISGGNSTTHSEDISSMNLSDTEKSYQLYGTDQITLTATPVDGFVFSGWYVRREQKADSLLTQEETLVTYLFEDDLTFVPVFSPDMENLDILPVDNFLVGQSLYQDLQQAITAAANGQFKTIVLLKDYTLLEGNYTLPEGITLLIPKNAQQTNAEAKLERIKTADAPSSMYRTLTLASGAHLEVYGTIEVGGTQSAGGVSGAIGIGFPTGTLGCLFMKDGSSITLNDGAILRAWGYVLGDRSNGKYLCEIDARRGSKVLEQFQIMDWKGGNYTLKMFDGVNSGTEEDAHRVLPVNQYYIQNVEVPVRFRPGAKLSAAGSVSINNVILNMDEAGVIGAKYTYSQDPAIFLMNDEDDSEDTWVLKYYNPDTDQQVYEINNSAYLGSLVISFQGYTANSSEYKLPITNNFKIHLLYGQMEITQHTEFLAGSELEINKKSTLTIPQDVNVYLYDKKDWGRYISVQGATMGSGTTVKWIPAIPEVREAGRPNVRRDALPNDTVMIEDTKWTISGTIDIKGKLFTTENGATVVSTNEDAGTVIFSSDAPADFTVSQITALYTENKEAYVTYKRIPCTSAQLKNASGYRTTAGTEAGISYCYMNGAWRNMEQVDQCFVKDGTTYFAKPQDYVQLQSGSEDGNHLFHSSDESRTFIHAFDNDGNCQWWEVTATATPGIYHCEHPKNDVYYYYDDSNPNPELHSWVEKKFKVSWVNWDGSPVKYKPLEGDSTNYYMVSYNTTPQWLSANPTRTSDASHEYSFLGWSPDLAPVTADVTYMATYQERDKMYAITFNNASDELIEVNYCKLGEIPVCTHHTLAADEEWKTAEGGLPLGAVSKDEVYKLFTKNTEGPFTIRFVNWDGEELQSGSIAKNTNPVYSGATPSKPADNSHAYTFVGWTPAIAPATENKTYTAKFEVQQLTGLNVVGEQTITTDLVIPNVRITTTGSLNVTGSVTANNFYLESNGSTASGQVIGGYASIDADHIYFDYNVNAKNHKWYGVAVPWEVDATSGISVNGKTLVLGKDFDIVYYNGALRAEVGKQKCWSYVEDDGDKTLQPGRLYMIGLMMDAPQGIRFAKKAGASILTTTTSVTAHPQTTGDVTDANWNGVANPALFHAYVNPGVTAAQVYIPSEKRYAPVTIGENKWVVGQGAFIQAPNTINEISVAGGGSPFSAPRRAKAEANTLYDVRIAPAEAEYTDRLFVRVEDEKEADTYVIGKDLAKLGVSKSVAQMWINRYNTELCLNTMTMENGVAEYPLSIFAPKAGEYTISSQSSVFSDQYTLYLTFNGEAIWNLSDAAYTGTFDAGTTSAYGLRISARAPQITTGIDEAVVDAKGETRKVLIDNQVFIIRGEKVYSVDGQLVK